MLDPRFELTVPKFSMCTGSGPERKKNRWEEELLLVKYEMQWTTKSFLHKAQQWEDRFEEPNVDPGPKAYAVWQLSQWRSIVLEADWLFQLANSEYTKIA